MLDLSLDAFPAFDSSKKERKKMSSFYFHLSFQRCNKLDEYIYT